VEIRPYFVLALDGGPATACGLGLVWPDFRSPGPPVRGLCALGLNAARPKVNNRLEGSSSLSRQRQ
jgi:hypothetical protein